ncbi:RNA methyltransferase [Motilimonas pumila]|uniref:TrmH family RNA methyltransferase n=1 Tax=Motilimonas pumila TaxID=2303987 RepID=A0A418Y9X9_9GAMM|nr:RNA methyltransferase [Motilimonas pumila]RJG38299.1 TrmH family RNA methyltransferase [Motilimonas pumila]
MKSSYTGIALSNPKSATNVGAVMRAAGCFQADQVMYNGDRYDRTVKLNTDTKRIRSKIPLQNISDFVSAKPEGAKLVCVDLVPGATPLPEFEHPDQALYVFGPEDGTIKQSLIDQADHVVYMPTIGCLNLAASVNILLYDRSAKLKSIEASDELVFSSRDTNNKVRIK